MSFGSFQLPKLIVIQEPNRAEEAAGAASTPSDPPLGVLVKLLFDLLAINLQTFFGSDEHFEACTVRCRPKAQ